MTDFMTNLTMSHIRPYVVDKVVAGWEDFTDDHAESGYVVKLVNGSFAYIVSERIPKRRSFVSKTIYFDEEPIWLYVQRARNWTRDEKVLNANLPFAKQAANYPKDESDRRSGGDACRRPGIRVQALEPGTSG